MSTLKTLGGRRERECVITTPCSERSSLDEYRTGHYLLDKIIPSGSNVVRQTVVNSPAVRYICCSTPKFIATTATTSVAQLHNNELDENTKAGTLPPTENAQYPRYISLTLTNTNVTSKANMSVYSILTLLAVCH